MSTSFKSLFLAALLLTLVQAIAALPWLWALNKRSFARAIRNPTVIGYAVGIVLVVAAALAFYFSKTRVDKVLIERGRWYGAVLHAQLAIGFLILAPQLLLLIWPKGGAVALATFRECWRQPMFWLMVVVAIVFIAASMVIPYFTFGEDYKMMKQIGFDIIMLFAVIFGLLASSISINEEIDGRTAITVMSKPVNRRQFLIGKYLGTLLACWAMMLLLGWCLNWALYITPHFNKLDDVNDTMPSEVVELLTPQLKNFVPTQEGKDFVSGVSAWLGEALAHHVGILLTFGQVMVLVSISVALATRMPFVINLVICLFIFFAGHLAPILVQVTNQMGQESAAMALIGFIAKALNIFFPALDYFDMAPAIIRESAVPMRDFAIYVGTVFGYAVLYSAIGLIAGLILFEDRDLA